MVQLVNKRVMEDRLDLLWISSLIVMAISNAFICIFGSCQITVGFCIALVAFVLAFITWIVLTIIKTVRFRKQVKKWKQGNY
jgi:membrane protein implicated in regulation of membrane protease activity